MEKQNFPAICCSCTLSNRKGVKDCKSGSIAMWMSIGNSSSVKAQDTDSIGGPLPLLAHMIWYMIWCVIWYDIWYDMILIYLTAIGLTLGCSSTVQIYT